MAGAGAGVAGVPDVGGEGAGVVVGGEGAGVARVLGGGPGEMSPLRQLLRLHQVVQQAERDPYLELLARYAYRGYAFTSTTLIIKALMEKEEDMISLRNSHAQHRVDLVRQELHLQSVIDALPPHQAGPVIAAKMRAKRSRVYHETQMRFAMRELEKISFHLEAAYSSLGEVGNVPLDHFDGAEAEQMAAEIDAVLETLADDIEVQEAEIQVKVVLAADLDAMLEALTDDKEVQQADIQDKEEQRKSTPC